MPPPRRRAGLTGGLGCGYAALAVLSLRRPRANWREAAQLFSARRRREQGSRAEAEVTASKGPAVCSKSRANFLHKGWGRAPY